MAREITHTDSGPYIVTPEDIDEEKGDVAICMCGLSRDYPFCDGSHQVTEDEDADARYKYPGDDPSADRRRIDAFCYADEK